jgi:hypothetical protein
MTEPAHPWWCSPTDCQLRQASGGMHLSRPARVESARSGLTMTVQVAQAGPVDGYPRSGHQFISLAVRYPESPAEEYSFAFDSDVARVVGWMLLRAGRPGVDG